MANLDIEHIGGDNYSFKASGCHLKYFVIWKGGEEPTVNNWIDLPNVSNYNYTMDFSIENNKGINFHVYDGNTCNEFRGKMFLPPERRENNSGNN